MSLTNEDKVWILAENAKLSAQIDRLPTHSDLNDAADKSREQLERVETSLLTEFHKWAGPVDQRLRSHREAIRALDLDQEHLKGRVEKLEPKH